MITSKGFEALRISEWLWAIDEQMWVRDWQCPQKANKSGLKILIFPADENTTIIVSERDSFVILTSFVGVTQWSYAFWSYTPLVLHPTSPTYQQYYSPVVLRIISPTAL